MFFSVVIIIFNYKIEVINAVVSVMDPLTNFGGPLVAYVFALGCYPHNVGETFDQVSLRLVMITE